MCVPVKFRFSRRNSTSNVRGSTLASRAAPFTRTRTATFLSSDIFVTTLHAFPASPAYRDSHGLLHQRGHQRAFIVRGTAHVTWRFGCFASRFARTLRRRPIDGFAPQFRLGL